MDILILSTFFAILAGTAKAIRDTIDFHFERSIFNQIKNEKIRLWFESDWRRRPDHIFFFLWDGWHCSESLLILFLVIDVLYKPDILQVIYFLLIMGITFEYLFHNKFLVNDGIYRY